MVLKPVITSGITLDAERHLRSDTEKQRDFVPRFGTVLTTYLEAFMLPVQLYATSLTQQVPPKNL